ncbi:hypothetical protein VTJ49DRAFT_2937 [Mycothermus thermophilus]|uniref:Uncharacterized protein n=1 Tax=Humicola insolens TaxID=85995 RepID=A0ABR3V9B1_HUMIN
MPRTEGVSMVTVGFVTVEVYLSPTSIEGGFAYDTETDGEECPPTTLYRQMRKAFRDEVVSRMERFVEWVLERGEGIVNRTVGLLGLGLSGAGATEMGLEMEIDKHREGGGQQKLLEGMRGGVTLASDLSCECWCHGSPAQDHHTPNRDLKDHSRKHQDEHHVHHSTTASSSQDANPPMAATTPTTTTSSTTNLEPKPIPRPQPLLASNPESDPSPDPVPLLSYIPDPLDIISRIVALMANGLYGGIMCLLVIAIVEKIMLAIAAARAGREAQAPRPRRRAGSRAGGGGRGPRLRGGSLAGEGVGVGDAPEGVGGRPVGVDGSRLGAGPGFGYEDWSGYDGSEAGYGGGEGKGDGDERALEAAWEDAACRAEQETHELGEHVATEGWMVAGSEVTLRLRGGDANIAGAAAAAAAAAAGVSAYPRHIGGIGLGARRWDHGVRHPGSLGRAELRLGRTRFLLEVAVISLVVTGLMKVLTVAVPGWYMCVVELVAGMMGLELYAPGERAEE